MKNLYILLITLFAFTFSNAQIGFYSNIVADNSNSINFGESVEFVDIDGDGLLDVLVGSHERLGWFKSLDGQGAFGEQREISVNVSFIKAIAYTDIDGDGDIDVVSASRGDNKVAWYENLDGLGNFGQQNIISSSVYSVRDVKIADIDGDGDADVISGSWDDDEVLWFENLDGAGNFSGPKIVSSVSYHTFSVEVIDIDGDNDLDVVVGTAFNVEWYENLDGMGNFGARQYIDNWATETNSVSSGDFDGDGDMDVVAGLGDINRVVWYENLDGLGTFADRVIIGNELYKPQQVYIADLDNDGDLDITATSFTVLDEVFWYENLDGQGNFSIEKTITDKANGARKISTGDYDLDGDLDIVIGSTVDQEIAIYENINGLGDFGEQNVISTNIVHPKYVTSADLDNDGDLDLLTASYDDDKIAWYENIDGLGTFGKQNHITSFAVRAEVAIAGDIDGDGDLDVISGSKDDNKLAWYENQDGLGDFGPQIIISDLVESLISIILIDVDGDGDLDIATTAEANGYILIWYENLDGLGNFGSEIGITEGNYQSIRSLIAYDIDVDGDVDIIQGKENNLGLLENTDGQGSFDYHNYGVYSGSVNALNIADIDGDGDMDIIVSGSYIYWLENIDGFGDFGVKHDVFASSFYATTLETLDVDNDGDIDIVAGSYSNDKLYWFENLNGQGIFGEEQLIADVVKIEKIVTGDINGDDKIDIISASYIGNIVQWFENLGVLGNVISGTIKLDVDLDGCDIEDVSVGNILIETDNGSNSFSTFTDNNGEYNFNTNEGDFTTIIGSNLPNYFTVAPSSHTSIFVGLDNTDIADFCLVPNQTINDVNIALYPLGDARPGFDVTYQMVYRNVGTNISTDAVELYFDESKVAFLEASETISTQTSNSLTFDYSDLNPFETRTVDVTFNVFTPPTTEIGDVLSFTTIVNPVAGDYTEEDNTFILEQTVIGAYDPNDIQVLEGDKIYLDQVDEYLHYIIRFQNVGTAEAINVSVTNILDPNLDWNTLQIENISHFNRIEIRDGNQVEFIFDNINLQDSTTNEVESHGYIQYKIKPKNSVNIGDSTSNSADIFFDFNPPIPTNTVTTLVVSSLVANPPSDLVICDDDNDGFAEFDLTINETEIIGGQDPTDLLLTFYESQIDAENAINSIINPEAYINIDNPQTIYARLESSNNGNFDTTNFNIEVLESPVANTPTPLEVCDDNGDGFADFDLTSKDDEIIGGEPDVIVTYHETQADAETGNNPLPNPYTNYVNPQVVSVRVINPDTGCFTIVVLELIVLQPPVIVAVDDLVIFDENNDGIEIFDLTIRIPEILNGQINVEVTYYETQQDAIDDVNVIANPTDYTNITNPQAIYTRLENLESCFSVGSFVIFADPDLGITQNLFENLKIYPNPTKRMLNVEANGLIMEEIAIINLQGMVLKNASNKNEIDVSGLATGIYFIQLSVEGKTVTKKFIKM